MGPSFFLSFSRLKGLLSAAAAAAVGGLGIHYGIAVPVANSRRSVWIEGSGPELNRTKGNPYDESAMNHYFAEDFGRKINPPNISKVLRVSDLEVDPDTKKSPRISTAGFSPEIAALESTTIEAIKLPNRKFWTHNSYILINAEALLYYTTNFLTSYAFLSEIEFPYKSYYYMNVINRMQKNDFIHDLIWSLAEESKYKKLMVRPESIRISFDLQEMDEKSMKKPIDAYPKDARKLNNFNFSFRVYNPNRKTETILRKIPLDPGAESEVSIRVQNSEIRPFSVPVRGIRWKAANWDLVPIKGSNFTVTINNRFPRRESKFMLEEKLNLIHGRSKFFEYLISTAKEKGELEASRALNSPTFGDFKKIASPMLAAITVDQIKKDVEAWYGAMYSQWMKIQFHDVEKLIGMIKAKIFLNEKGESVSLMHQVVNNSNFRENFFSHIALKKNVKSVLNGFFDEKIKQHKMKLDEILAFMTKTMETLNKLKDKLKVTFEWLQEPKLEYSPDYDGDIYPAVSLEFKQKIELEEDFEISFKDSQEVDGTKVTYDFSKRLDALKEILLPLKSGEGKLNLFGVADLDIFNVLIPDVKSYVGWEKFVLKKEHTLTSTFKAYKSPIRPAVEANSNMHDHINGAAVFGWKILDVTATYDYSKFSDFFYQFYEKIDLQKEAANVSVITLLTDYEKYLREQLNDKPLTSLLKHINFIFPRDDKRKSALKTFLDTLLEREIKLNSTQLFVGYSRAYFDIAEDFVNSLKTEENNGKMVFKTQKNSKYEITGETYKFPAVPKNPTLKKIIESFHIFYSIYYPNPPIIFKSPSGGEEYNEFLAKEAATSVGLMNHSEKLKSILKKHYKVGTKIEDGKEIYRYSEESFPPEGAVDWSKVKVSFAQLDFAKAINSVTALALGDSVKTYASFAKVAGKDINISTIFSELVQRDLFLVSVNLMMEDGSLEIYNFPNQSSKRNSHSVHNFSIMPRFDTGKITI